MAKAVDLAYVVYESTDLEVMERFMNDFGLVTAQRSPDVLYLRAAGSAPYIHVTCRGDQNRFIGAGLVMSSREDLDELAQLEGSGPVEPITDAPGGGYRVRMKAPDGFQIDAIWGWQSQEPIPHRPANSYNWGESKARVNSSLRPKREPGLVLRLGHFVLRVTSHETSLAWFVERFGMLVSDSMWTSGPDSKPIGTFLRFDGGEELVDHHSLLINEASRIGAHHCAFEMQDIDSVMGAHDFLVSKGYQLDVGVGRHLIGSQIFDYWKDPFGNRVEHYTDGDVNTASYEGEMYRVAAEDTTQWGMDPTPDFFH